MKARWWMFIFPSLILISITAFIPMMVVFNYSFHRLIAGFEAEFLGFGNFVKVLSNNVFRNALLRNLGFTGLVLGIEIPLGLAIGKYIPKRGTISGIAIGALSLPLVLPWISVGMIWRLLLRHGGFIPWFLGKFGIAFSTNNPTQLFISIVALDVWHWTPLVALIMLAGYAAMPKEPIQAAKIDRASSWKIFRHIELPNLRFPLLMAVLLRFMDSFRIFSEPWIIAGQGASNATNFLSTDVYSTALGKFQLGLAAAKSLIYLFVAIVIAYIILLILTKGRGPLQR